MKKWNKRNGYSWNSFSISQSPFLNLNRNENSYPMQMYRLRVYKTFLSHVGITARILKLLIFPSRLITIPYSQVLRPRPWVILDVVSLSLIPLIQSISERCQLFHQSGSTYTTTICSKVPSSIPFLILIASYWLCFLLEIFSGKSTWFKSFLCLPVIPSVVATACGVRQDLPGPPLSHVVLTPGILASVPLLLPGPFLPVRLLLLQSDALHQHRRERGLVPTPSSGHCSNTSLPVRPSETCQSVFFFFDFLNPVHLSRQF